jgi:hypothetical protein
LPEAQWLLGVLYETGRCGLEKNPALTKEWKDKATANGFLPDEDENGDGDDVPLPEEEEDD